MIALILSFIFKKPVEDADDLANSIEDTVFSNNINVVGKCTTGVKQNEV